MHLTFRPAKVPDLDVCIKLFPPEYVCVPDLLPRMRDIWRRWLADGALKLIVVESGDHPGGSHIVGFGSSVFVTDEFAEEVVSSQAPMSFRTTRRALDGVAPVLGRHAIARANARDGLNLYVLSIGWDSENLTTEEIRWVKAKIFEAFFFAHGGYNVKFMMQEVYSGAEAERGRQIGVKLLNNYAQYYRDLGAAIPPASSRPHLIGCRREDIRDGSAISPLFLYARPRFSFKAGEQELLLYALIGDSDDALADGLSISLSAVHKRWQAIYEQVAAVAPQILPAAAAADQRRGSEKRRRLLAYLRSHLEELRPYEE